MIYTSFFQKFGKLYFRGRKPDGTRIQFSDRDLKPTLYVKGPGKYKNIYGDMLHAKEFDSIKLARDFIKDYGSSLSIHGNSAFEYDFIHRQFNEEIDASIDQLSVCIIDIETTAENGQIDTERTPEKVLLITCSDMKGKMVTFGFQPSSAPNYINCGSEEQLLQKFIEYIVETDPDIISGWNSTYFDIAYLGSRITKLLGSRALDRLSPFGIVEKKIDKILDREQLRWDIAGRIQLDLLDLYKKFRLINRPKYKLDYIGQIEVGERKLESEYKRFSDRYKHDWENFVLYNQQDVRLVEKLENKLGFIYLAVSLAYMCKVNFDDVFSPIKLWENYIKHTLLSRNLFIELKKRSNGSDDSIVGGYVSQPDQGMYKWVVTFDAASLYPSIIMALNMSPETLKRPTDLTIEKLLEESGVDRTDTSLCYAANGSTYSKDSVGILAELTEIVFNRRKTAKNGMLAAKNEMQLIQAELKKRGIDV